MGGLSGANDPSCARDPTTKRGSQAPRHPLPIGQAIALMTKETEWRRVACVHPLWNLQFGTFVLERDVLTRQWARVSFPQALVRKIRWPFVLHKFQITNETRSQAFVCHPPSRLAEIWTRGTLQNERKDECLGFHSCWFVAVVTHGPF